MPVARYRGREESGGRVRAPYDYYQKQGKTVTGGQESYITTKMCKSTETVVNQFAIEEL